MVINSLPQGFNQAQCSKLAVLDISCYFAEAIQRTHNGSSLGDMFDERFGLEPQGSVSSLSSLDDELHETQGSHHLHRQSSQETKRVRVDSNLFHV